MIEYAKIQNFEDGKIRVKMPMGETILAPVIVGANVVTPSSDWIENNKSNYLAVVSYQGSSNCYPLILGFLPLKSSSSETNNVVERMLKLQMDIIDLLINAKVNTQIGPQPFMADVLSKLNNYKSETEEIKKLIYGT